jgi:nitrate reductase NapE component
VALIVYAIACFIRSGIATPLFLVRLAAEFGETSRVFYFLTNSVADEVFKFLDFDKKLLLPILFVALLGQTGYLVILLSIIIGIS